MKPHEHALKNVLCRINAPDYAGLQDDDAPFSLQDFQDNFKIKIIKHTRNHLVFEMIGINVAIANALRRIMIAEVPTMAIDKVIIRNNTTVIHDEVLAHRLGLLPIRADPTIFDNVEDINQYNISEKTALTFKLDIACKRKEKGVNTMVSTDPLDKYSNAEVYSSSLEWKPIGNQPSIFKSELPCCVYNDILIAKMRPGQAISLEAHAIKGHGSIHAKWSPVATASYQMLPVVHITEPFLNEDAHKLVASCPMKVFDIEDCHEGVKAVASRPRSCTLCRECIRPPENQSRISLERVKSHFIFSVESSGCVAAATIVSSAIAILRSKATLLEAQVTTLIRPQQ